MSSINVLFVCMGNICRSPTAEGVFRKHVQDAGLEHHFNIDSAGTHAYHIGSSPDRRARDAALRRQVDLNKLRARQVSEQDFESFDYILVMDRVNHSDLEDICPDHHSEKLELFLSYASQNKEEEVPDPYYGSLNGFEYVLDLVESASNGLLEAIRKKHNI